MSYRMRIRKDDIATGLQAESWGGRHAKKEDLEVVMTDIRKRYVADKWTVSGSNTDFTVCNGVMTVEYALMFVAD